MAGNVQPVPDRLHTVTPRLIFRGDTFKAIEFQMSLIAGCERGRRGD